MASLKLAASPDAAYALARHGNTRPVLVKRLVDMVRFEDQDIRLRAEVSVRWPR